MEREVLFWALWNQGPPALHLKQLPFDLETGPEVQLTAPLLTLNPTWCRVCQNMLWGANHRKQSNDSILWIIFQSMANNYVLTQRKGHRANPEPDENGSFPRSMIWLIKICHFKDFIGNRGIMNGVMQWLILIFFVSFFCYIRKIFGGKMFNGMFIFLFKTVSTQDIDERMRGFICMFQLSYLAPYLLNYSGPSSPIPQHLPFIWPSDFNQTENSVCHLNP